MEFEIRLARTDFYHLLKERTQDAALGRVSLAVGALAVAGALGVIALQGWRQGLGLLVLGIAFALWNPFLLYQRAGRLYRAAKGMWKLHYAVDAAGMTIAPPGGRECRVGWDEVMGVCWGRTLVVIYKDAGHAYLLPRGQFPAQLPDFLRGCVRILDTPPADPPQ